MKSKGQTSRVTVFAAVGSITYGYGASIIAQVLGQPEFFRYFHLDQTGPGLGRTNAILGAMNGLFFSGGALGALFMAWTAFAYGRLFTIRLACVVCIFGGALMTGAVNVAMYLVSRFIMGWGVGMMVCAVPLYQAELAPPQNRGFHVGLHGIALGIGYLGAAIVGLGCYYAKDSSFAWRFPFSVQILPAIVLLVGSGFLPESPRWLLNRGDKDKAWETLKKLHTDPRHPEETSFAMKEMYQITQQFAMDKARMESSGIRHWWDFFKHRNYQRRLIVGCGATLASACSGNLVVNNYQVTLYNGLGVTGSLPITLYAVWLVVALFGNLASATILMDKYGRKRLLMIGIVGTGGCLVGLTIITKYFVETNSTNKVGLGFGIFFIFLYVVFYSTFIDSEQYVIVSETFPIEFRTIGVALSLFSQTAAAALFVGVAPVSFEHVGWKFYLLFIFLDCCTFVMVWLLFPETKGLTLEEINGRFGDPVAVHLTDGDDQQSANLEVIIETMKTRHEVKDNETAETTMVENA